jgi:hypothetical protein
VACVPRCKTSAANNSTTLKPRIRKLWSEDNMDRAVDDVTSGKLSMRRAAEVYNVPR